MCLQWMCVLVGVCVDIVQARYGMECVGRCVLISCVC